MRLGNPWGDLEPIPHQVAADVVGLISLAIVVSTRATNVNAFLLGATVAGTVVAAGNWTNRWPMTFPMIPFVVLQLLRRIIPPFSSSVSSSSSKKFGPRRKSLWYWLGKLIGLLSLCLIFIAGSLSILFPAVRIPDLPGAPYEVGVVDLFLPVDSFSIPSEANQDKPHGLDPEVCPAQPNHVSVRLFYPTLDAPVVHIPYIRPATSEIYCAETMIAGAPPPIKPFGWMLHTWRLTTTRATYGATPLSATDSSIKLPIVVFSHGLGGNLDMYAYQTRHLAAQGFLVMVLDHTDGSAPIVPLPDGTFLRRNDSHVTELESQNKTRFLEGRRAMTAYRAHEFVAAVESLLALNKQDILPKSKMPISLIDQLDTDSVHYMGHSFGGATCIHAARLRSPTSIIAHEPAIEWMPDDTRASLFDKRLLEGVQGNRMEYWAPDMEPSNHTLSIHDHPSLFLFSYEWAAKGWSGIDILVDMDRKGRFGPKEPLPGEVHVIDKAHHNEFSDSCLLTPTWLARATNITGSRSPVETSFEMHQRTVAFLRAVEKAQSTA